MALAPGNSVGEEITVDNKVYVWDGYKWVILGGGGSSGGGGGGPGGTVSTLDVILRAPDPTGGTTQASANQYLLDKTEEATKNPHDDLSFAAIGAFIATNSDTFIYKDRKENSSHWDNNSRTLYQ